MGLRCTVLEVRCGSKLGMLKWIKDEDEDVGGRDGTLLSGDIEAVSACESDRFCGASVRPLVIDAVSSESLSNPTLWRDSVVLDCAVRCPEGLLLVFSP